MNTRVVGSLAVCAAVLAAALLAHLTLGSVRIPLAESLRVLSGRPASVPVWGRIILEFRLPRALTALVAGAGLAAGGLLMQTLFRNPLAGPDVLGITAGASLGVALVVLGGGMVGARVAAGSGLLSGLSLLGDVLVSGAAVAGAAGVLSVVLLVSRRVENVLTLLVLGVLFSHAVGSSVSVLMHFSIPEQIQSYVNWTFGSFAGVTRAQFPIMAGAVGAGLAATVGVVKPLNAMLLGEAYASSMGVRVRLARIGIIVVTAVMAGTVTAFCGPIAFIGVAVPHLARSIVKDADHRVLLPVTVLLGSTVTILADLAASVPGFPITLPLNAVTALLGAPVVISVVLRRGGLQGTFA